MQKTREAPEQPQGVEEVRREASEIPHEGHVVQPGTSETKLHGTRVKPLVKTPGTAATIGKN